MLCRLCGLFPGYPKPDFTNQYKLSLPAASLCALCVKTTIGKGSRKDRKGNGECNAAFAGFSRVL
jgi:hypothetical protein